MCLDSSDPDFHQLTQEPEIDSVGGRERRHDRQADRGVDHLVEPVAGMVAARFHERSQRHAPARNGVTMNAASKTSQPVNPCGRTVW